LNKASDTGQATYLCPKQARPDRFKASEAITPLNGGVGRSA